MIKYFIIVLLVLVISFCMMKIFFYKLNKKSLWWFVLANIINILLVLFVFPHFLRLFCSDLWTVTFSMVLFLLLTFFIIRLQVKKMQQEEIEEVFSEKNNLEKQKILRKRIKKDSVNYYKKDTKHKSLCIVKTDILSQKNEKTEIAEISKESLKDEQISIEIEFFEKNDNVNTEALKDDVEANSEEKKELALISQNHEADLLPKKNNLGNELNMKSLPIMFQNKKRNFRKERIMEEVVLLKPEQRNKEKGLFFTEEKKIKMDLINMQIKEEKNIDEIVKENKNDYNKQKIFFLKNELKNNRNNFKTPFLVIELANYYKKNAMYQEAVNLFLEYANIDVLRKDNNMMMEFVNAGLYMKKLLEQLKKNNLCNIPFDKLPKEVKNL